MEKPQPERVKKILELLDREYGTEYRCYLNHENAWQLLIAVILSAQCTDARVNIVTKDLFQKYDTLEKFANADQAELEKDIHSTGFFRMKAKNNYFLCQSTNGTFQRRSAKNNRGADFPGRSGKKNSECNTWKYLPRSQVL